MELKLQLIDAGFTQEKTGAEIDIERQENEAKFIGSYIKSRENIYQEISKLGTTIKRIFGIFSTEIKENDLLHSLPDIKKHLKDLELNENNDVNLFIEQASIIVCSLKKLKESTEMILRDNGQTEINKGKIEKIKEEIETLKNYNFFEKIIKPVDSKIKKLEFEEKLLTDANKVASSLYTESFGLSGEIRDTENNVGMTISSIAQKEITEKLGKEVKMAVNKSWELIEDIKSNSLSLSIGESYIKNVALQSTPGNKDENLEKKLFAEYKLYTESGHMYEQKYKNKVIELANELNINRPDDLFRIDNGALGLLFSTDVSERLSNLKNTFINLQQTFNKGFTKNNNYILSDNDIDNNFGLGIYPSNQNIQISLDLDIEKQPLLKKLGYGGIKDWQAVKKSQLVNSIFGEKVKYVDGVIYNNLIVQVLTNFEDSALITSLNYYKTPEALQAALLLSISNKYYCSRDANYLINNMAKDKKWLEILDRTEKKYPYFKSLHEVLAKWNASDFAGESDYLKNPKINDNMLQDFVAGIAENGNNKSEIDKKTTILALNSLDAERMIPLLEKNDLILKDEKTKIENLSTAWSNKKGLKNHLKECFHTMLCKKYENEDVKNEQEKINFYLKIFDSYSEYFLKIAKSSEEKIVTSFIDSVNNKKLTKDRVLELANPIKTRNGEVDFMNLKYSLFALNTPELYLDNNDGLDLFVHIQKYGIDLIDSKLDTGVGNKLVHSNIKDYLIENTIKYINYEFIDNFSNNNFEITKDNWKSTLINLIQFNQGQLVMVDPKIEEFFKKLNNAFISDNPKNLCLNEMKKSWIEYLEGGDKNKFPFSSSIIAGCIKNNNGAGPLSQIASLGFFQDNYSRLLASEQTIEKTKDEVFDGMKMMEEKFMKEKWSNEDTTNFYNISKDIVSVAPSLFSTYLEVFAKLKPKDIKIFLQDVFPLHRVIIAIIEKKDKNGNRIFSKRDLAGIRKDFVKSIIDEFGNLKSISEQKNELTDFILENFKNKFGIIKVKENFTQEHFRSLNNIPMYLSNIAKIEKKEYYENVLSVYLALMINDKWDDFKNGAEINFQEFLTEDKAYFAKNLAANKTEINPVIQENLGISAKELPEFYNVLNSEVENVVIGNVETIDNKLNNVISNLDSLKDLDLYPPDSLDRRRMKMLLDYGSKKTGEVVAKIYQSLVKTKGDIKLSGDEEKIKNDIEYILKSNNLEMNTANIKKTFQEEMRPFSIVMNMLSFVEEMGVKNDVFELRELLKPSQEIISIFSKLGEEFKQTSGVMALSQDLEYLESVISKNENKITIEENSSVKEYLNQINIKLTKLEDSYKKIIEKFNNVKQGHGVVENKSLKDRLDNIDKIINIPTDQVFITSGITSNLNYIIENIRNCLSCVTDGINNDTNLTFGDQNKFYLYSKTGKWSKSISDEILFLEPIKHDDTSEMSFIFDQVYGTKTPTILLNQIEVVIKKYKEIKKKFLSAKLSLFVTDSALLSSGLSVESLKHDLPNMKCETKTINVNVLKSPVADHYIEIGGGNTRSSGGERTVSGVLLR